MVNLRQAFRQPRKEADTGWSRIIVPVTDVDLDSRMLQIVERLAKRQRIEISIVYVVEVVQSMPLDAELPGDVARGEHVLRATRDHIAERVDPKQNQITTELLQARSTGAAIVDEAIDSHASVIIVSAKLQRKHGVLSIGDTVDYVLRNAHCEVVVVRSVMPEWLVEALELDLE